ncbi:MAG: low molecular weight protein-tyrosine-phosphatase [Pseudohongiella sp.]|nr:low molecular weight protein-tyrosine-phosphatase [Pseudohongiella sp.]
MSPYRNILVVCQGNVCRSPVAQAMLKHRMPDKNIQSAGLTALTGHGVESTAAELATAAGLDVSGHKARQIDSDMIQWADLILVMSQNQRGQLGKTAPESLGKTMLLGHWVQGPGSNASIGLDIPDPYRKSRDVFEHVHKMINQAVTLWATKI